MFCWQITVLIARNKSPEGYPAARKALSALTIPVIVVHGDDDSFVPPAFAAALRAELERAEPHR